jgi:hypothetical protein
VWRSLCFPLKCNDLRFLYEYKTGDHNLRYLIVDDCGG